MSSAEFLPPSKNMVLPFASPGLFHSYEWKTRIFFAFSMPA